MALPTEILAQIILGQFLLHRRYSLASYFSCFFLVAGFILAFAFAYTEDNNLGSFQVALATEDKTISLLAVFISRVCYTLACIL